MTPDIMGATVLRPALATDIDGIVSLINGYAVESIMLFRSPDSVYATLHDFVVTVDAHDTVVACGALRAPRTVAASVSRRLSRGVTDRHVD